MFHDFTTYRPLVEGYPAQWSYQPGDAVTFHCSARTPSFSVEIARITDARLVVWTQAAIPGSEQPVPPTAYRDGCDWPVTFMVSIPLDWPSGFYEVAFHADGASGVQATGHAFFVVREIDGLGDLEYTATILFGDDSPANCAKVAHNHAVMGLYQRGGTVFNAGTTDWAYGLESDPLVQQVTKNVLDRLSQPAAM